MSAPEKVPVVAGRRGDYRRRCSVREPDLREHHDETTGNG